MKKQTKRDLFFGEIGAIIGVSIGTIIFGVSIVNSLITIAFLNLLLIYVILKRSKKTEESIDVNNVPTIDK
jgi:hypothetical protein